jgi:alkylhydroperoxidase family enzyme
MRKNMRKSKTHTLHPWVLVLVPAAALGMALVPAAMAEGTDASPSAERPGGLTEVIVTARRKEESVQDVPISISVFDQKTLNERKGAVSYSTIEYQTDDGIRTLVQHPALLRNWNGFAMYLIKASSLSARDREILILHTCAQCHATYDVAHHTVIARRAGLTNAEIEAAIRDGAGLASFERTLLKAAEELIKDRCISDATWAALAGRYTRQQLMDLVFTVGNYVLMAMATRTFGVPLEDDIQGGWKPS